MAYENAQRIPLSPKKSIFSWWYVDNSTNLDLWPNYSPYLRNARLDWQWVIIRPWTILFATLTQWVYPKGIGSYLRTDPDDDRLIVRHNQVIPAYLTGGTGATSTIATRQAVTDGSFSITLDGIIQDVVNIDFSACTSMAEVAAKIQTEIRALTEKEETVTWSTDHFIITADNNSTSTITVTSAVAPAVGTDISGEWATAFMDSEVARGTVTSKVTTNKLLSIDTAWVITPIATASLITSNNRMSFINTADKLYCMNGADLYWQLSGTTYTCPTAKTPSGFAPAFGVLFNSSIFASGWWTNPNIVYKSVWDTYDDFTSTGSDQFTFGEPVTGLETIAEALFYFTKNTISITNTQDITDTGGTITYTNRKLQVSEWAENNNCIVWCGNEIYYLTSSNTINKIVRWQNVYWFETLDVSNRPYNGISKIMGKLDKNQDTAFWYYLPDSMLIKRHLKSIGSTINDIIIVYDTTKDARLVDTGKYMYDGVWFKWHNYTISNVEWKVYWDEWGQDDEDAPIVFEYKTKEFYISSPTLKKWLWETRTLLDVNANALLTQQLLIDWQVADTATVVWSTVTTGSGISSTSWTSWAPQALWETEIWVSAIWEDGDVYIAPGSDIDSDYSETYILRTKWNLNRKWTKFQWRFTNSTVAGKVRLKDITAKCEVLSELTTNL